MGWVCIRVKSAAVSQIARLRPRPRQELRSAPLNSHSSVTAGTTHISSMLDIMLNPLIGGSSEANAPVFAPRKSAISSIMPFMPVLIRKAPIPIITLNSIASAPTRRFPYMKGSFFRIISIAGMKIDPTWIKRELIANVDVMLVSGIYATIPLDTIIRHTDNKNMLPARFDLFICNPSNKK